MKKLNMNGIKNIIISLSLLVKMCNTYQPASLWYTVSSYTNFGNVQFTD